MRARVLSLLFYEITLQQSIAHFYNSWTPETQHCPRGKGGKCDSDFYGKITEFQTFWPGLKE